MFSISRTLSWVTSRSFQASSLWLWLVKTVGELVGRLKFVLLQSLSWPGAGL